MIFGLKILCLVLLFFGGASPLHADWPGAWGLTQLGEALAEAPEGRVAFTETRTVSYLDAPITLSGYVLRQGDRIEKHIVSPMQESIVIDGTTVQVDTAEGEHHRFDINDHGLIKGLAMALKATLTGDLNGLDNQFDVTLSGAASGWQLHLVPLDDSVRKSLPGLTLAGAEGIVETIEIEGENGDTSIMTLQHSVP
jgi:outer membrane lipoprotein carrier protein LolA